MFAARETQRTIVLVSTSGGSGGDAGRGGLRRARRARPAPFDAAIVLGDLAGRERAQAVRGALLRRLRQRARRAAAHGRRRDHAEAGGNPGAPSALGQLAHLAFPFAAGEQGALDASGLPAVLVQVSRRTRRRPPGEAVSAERLEGFGRAVLSAVDALDTAPDDRSGPADGFVIGAPDDPRVGVAPAARRRCCPAAAAAADGYARLRRRRGPRAAIGRCCGAWRGRRPARCRSSWRPVRQALGRLGALRAAPAMPVLPSALPFEARPCGRCWRWRSCSGSPGWCGRGRAAAGARASRPDDDDAAGLAMLMVLLASRSVVVGGQSVRRAAGAAGAAPVAAARLSRSCARARSAALALVALALLPLALLIAFYAHQLGLGPGEVAWTAVLLLAGGHVGIAAAVLWSLAFGCVGGRRAARARRPSGTRPTGSATARRSRSAARCPTRARARSAEPSRLCDDRSERMSDVSVHHEIAPAQAGAVRARRAWRVLAVALIARRRARAARRRGHAGVAGAVLRAVREIPPGPPERDAARGRTRDARRRSSGARWRACPTSASGSRSWPASCSATRATAARWGGS